MKKLYNNKYLKTFDFNKYNSLEKAYLEAVKVLETKVKKVKQIYISKVFYSTTFSQNGFLDAVIILSANINLVKEIFIIYNGRVSVQDLFNIAAKIYTAMAIAGSEGVEYAIDELI